MAFIVCFETSHVLPKHVLFMLILKLAIKGSLLFYEPLEMRVGFACVSVDVLRDTSRIIIPFLNFSV